MITATRNHGARFLFPCGDLARDEVPAALSEAGAIVDRVVVYRTVRAESSGYESLRERLLGRGIDVVTFASPSAVSGFVEVFQDVPLADLSRLARIAVIGPTTAAAVRTAGGSPDIVARVSSAAGLVQAIDDYYQT
jgi:uroporphyrinogen-III synthase